MIFGAALLLAGIAMAGIGGELFVRGLVGVAHWARIAPGIVALTLAAFATSSPELSVSMNGALGGQPEIGLGNALGGNVVNMALVLGLALCLGRLEATTGSMRRDFPVAFLGPILTALLVLDGELSRSDGILLLALFAAWLVFAFVEAWRQRSAAEQVLGERRRLWIILSCVIGLALLVAAGRFIVVGAVGVGQALGLDVFVVGATIVALGTSTPELATTIVARLRGHGEVGLGTVLGSNVFNGLFIVGLVAILHPITIASQEVVVGLGFGALAVAALYPRRDRSILRRRGPLLLAIYGAFVVALLQYRP